MKKNIKSSVAFIAAIMMLSSTITANAFGAYDGDFDSKSIVSCEASPTAFGVSVDTVRITDCPVSSSAVRIKWNKVWGASGYRVYRLIDGKWKKVVTIHNGNTLYYRDTNVDSFTQYQYKVKAFKKYKGKTYWGKASSAAICTTKPAEIKFLGFGATEDSIRLNWTPVKCEGYEISQKQSDGTYKQIANLRYSGANTYKVSGLDSATKYGFKIRAYGRGVDGEFIYGKTTSKAKTTKAMPEVEMPDDTRFSSAVVDGTSCTFTWKTVKCDGYEIYMSGFPYGSKSAPNFFYRKVLDIPNGSISTAKVSNLCSGSDYSFQILPYKLKADGTKVYGFYNIQNNHGITEITIDPNYDEINAEEITWETENIDITVKVNYEESFRCLDIINAERAKEGAEPLVMDKEMMDKAITRVAESCYVLSGNHIRPNGRNCFSIGEGSENVCGADFWNYEEGDLAKGASELWISHTPHRNNLVNSAWNSTGIAIIEIDDCYGKSFIAVETFSSSDATQRAVRPLQKTKTITRTIEAKKYIWTY